MPRTPLGDARRFRSTRGRVADESRGYRHRAGVALAGGLRRRRSPRTRTPRPQARQPDRNGLQTFKENGKALKDLAADIQPKTAADADAIVGAQALMVQFGLTEAQTPLTLPSPTEPENGGGPDTAAKAALKAALRRPTPPAHGDQRRRRCSLDPPMPRRRCADGRRVAEHEGAFSGQAERMKNRRRHRRRLAVCHRGVRRITDKARPGGGDGRNPELANTAGKLAIGGGRSLPLVASTAAGWLLKMRDRFTPVSGEGDNAVRSLNGTGKPRGTPLPGGGRRPRVCSPRTSRGWAPSKRWARQQLARRCGRRR